MNTSKPRIGRGAIVTVGKILDGFETNVQIEQLLLEFDLVDDVASQGSIAKTVHELVKFAVTHPDRQVPTDFGMKPLAVVLVEQAITQIGWSHRNAPHWEKLQRYLNLDGFTLLIEAHADWLGNTVVDRISGPVVAMPQFVELPESSSELDSLLERNEFQEAVTHLASAKANFTQGDWVAANSQCRTFLEAITNAIAETLYPTDVLEKRKSLQKRQLLATKGFLSGEKCEFGDGSKPTFLPGLSNLLHTDGAHPGISNRDDALFRLQTVVVTGLWLMKRFEECKMQVTADDE